jgi:molecular chaperone DnaJ
MDYYSILGVDRNASQKEITDAYRGLARKYHPDVNPDGAEEFKKITKAFEVLNNSQKRAEYDRFGSSDGGNRNPFGANPFGFGFPNAEDLFRDIFTGKPRSQQSRGPDVYKDLEISFYDALFGSKQSIVIAQRRRCDHCDNGAIGWNTCPLCNGSGQRTINQRPFIIQTVCNNCNATGKIITARCEQCKGTGFIDGTVTETLEFDVPAGVDEGMQVRLAGKGEPGAQNSGDLYVRLKISPHPLFKRNDIDLYCTYLLPYTQLILGTNLVIPLHKTNIELKIPPNTASGTKFKVAGHGVKKINTHQSGDLYVEVQADIPDQLTPDLLNSLAEQERQFPSKDRKKFEETLLTLKNEG